MSFVFFVVSVTSVVSVIPAGGESGARGALDYLPDRRGLAGVAAAGVAISSETLEAQPSDKARPWITTRGIYGPSA